MARDWTWKVADRGHNERLQLRYEPGGWGDVIKGMWAVHVAGALARGRDRLRVTDPFAGAPDYPRVPAVAERLAALRAGPAAEDPVVAAFLAAADARGTSLLPSTASLVAHEVGRAGARAELEVFELDADRRARWSGLATHVEVASGDEALEREADLLLVDPYDLAADWPRVRPRVAARARDERAALLFYYFNRAPRGATALREYRAWRDDLSLALGPRASLVGRVPSDAVLPRAWHEVVLAGPPDVVAPLAGALGAATRALARHLSDAGCFEQG